MESRFICPFCKRNMVTVPNEEAVYCHWDGFKVNFKTKRGTFIGRRAPYIDESLKFMKSFQKTDPICAMGDHPLWTHEFRFDECVFIGCREIDHDAKCLDMNAVDLVKTVTNKYLLGGNRIYTDEIISLFQGALLAESENNPLVRTQVPDLENILYMKTLLESNKTSLCTVDIQKATNSFFATSLEGMLNRVYNLFDTQLADVTDEQAMYCHIFVEPSFNISWGIGAKGIIASCRNFIDACCNDIETVEKKPYEDPAKGAIPDSVSKETDKMHLLSMPSTALNNYDYDHNVYFDIMNHEWQYDYMSEYDDPAKFLDNITVINRTYSFLHAMWYKYAITDTNFAVAEKLELLEKMTGKSTFNVDSGDDLVLEFWKEIPKYIKKGITDGYW